MRKSLILLAAAAPLMALAAVALPAIGSADAPEAATPPSAGALDLDQIPVKPVTGPQSVSGVAGDDESGECDDGSVWSRKAHGMVHAVCADDEHERDGSEGDDD